ncbi:hypothetical protein [Clostridium sp.]|nr:hypothetical protein [Clostridium sp.]MDU5108478.1 hypothetical protein [Clostridium sp.]
MLECLGGKVYVILIIDTQQFNRKQRESYEKEIKEKILVNNICNEANNY